MASRSTSSTVIPPREALPLKSASSRAVFVKPGMTLFTVMPKRPSSDASVFVQFAIAARTVFETPRPLIGVITEVLVTLMMRP